jgi:hypothetical protein
VKIEANLLAVKEVQARMRDARGASLEVMPIMLIFAGRQVILIA